MVLAKPKAEQLYSRYYEGLLIRIDEESFFMSLFLPENESFTENQETPVFIFFAYDLNFQRPSIY